MAKIYKSIIVSPKGLRIKGDDLSTLLAKSLDEECNKFSDNGWKLVSVLPSLTSQGAVVKLLVTFARAIPESD